ncbi:HigA family addiction module antitoxin [Roseibium limicola]|uniref:HigA family addiction module antidote protein n=1 Tax=Roseibium limicola TaxID=2816037 RepID=A0A939ER96_9HYPH|nr:HigA family addiction module antitoxin [Roseibium limicola]MBO0347219.1 HigA family addiction module antidote protein [Roseibium limicola]
MTVPAFHPGEILKELYLEPLGLSAGKLAKALGLDRQRIQRLIKQETSLTADTALHLAKAFDTTPQYWLNMQINYDLQSAENSPRTKAALDSVQRLVEIEPASIS